MLENITLYQFNSLGEDEKGECLREYGVRISERFDDFYGYMLYQINSFYVEVQYNCTDNVVEKLVSFSNTNELEAYISEIDISGMLE